MIIAADTGGSKTLLRLCDRATTVEEIHMEGFGAAVDYTEDIPSLREKLSALAGKYPIEAVAFNLGGRNKVQIEKVLQTVFPGVPYQVFRESEGNAAMALATNYNCECVLLAGTGTIAIGRHPETNKHIICGGWGCTLGDQGSGYHIGLSALQHCMEQMDLAAPDHLSRQILGMDHGILCSHDTSSICQARDDLFYKLSPLSRSHIASYTKIVASCCRQGDPVSLMLMENAGKHMADLIAKAMRKLDLVKASGVLVTGGLLNTKGYWQASFEAALKEQFDISKFHYIPDGVIRGTQIIAAKLAQLQPLQEG